MIRISFAPVSRCPGPDLTVKRFHGSCRLSGNRKVEEDSECSDEAYRKVVRVVFLAFSWRFRSALLDISYWLAGVSWLQWTRMRFVRSLRLRRVSMFGGS